MLQQLQNLASDNTIRLGTRLTIHGYQTCPLLEFFPTIGAWTNVMLCFSESWVEDCLEVNFRYVDYQPLAHLSYSSYVCCRSVRVTRAKRYLSVRVSINVSIPKRLQISCSIDLCYIKIICCIWNIHSHSCTRNYENCDIQGGAIHITTSMQQSWRWCSHGRKAFECLITLKCPLQISLL